MAKWLDKYDAPQAQNGIEGTMGGLTDVGFNYNGAWGGTMQMGGVLPGAVGFTYARTAGAAPANGPYAKKTKASAQDGDDITKGKEFLTKMAKSPLFGERYATMTNRPLEQIDPKEIEDYRGRIIKNLETVKIAAPGEDPEPNFFEQNPLIQGIYYPAKHALFTHGFVQPGVMTHELSHSSTRGRDDLAFKARPFDYVSSKEPEAYDEDSREYLTTPTEIKARRDAVAQMMMEKGTWNPITEKFTEKHYDQLKAIEKDLSEKMEKNIPVDRKLTEVIGQFRDISIPYSKEEAIRIFNSFVKGKDKKSNAPIAQNGQEMKYYQEGLDFKPKTISQDGSDIPVDPMGYWNPENVGNPVIIPSNIITMEGVDQPLIGISDTGDVQYMEPGEDYEFDGEYVTEYPVAQKGKTIPVPTTADSARLYNAQVALNKFYENEMKAGRIKKDYTSDFNPRNSFSSKSELIPEGLRQANLDFYRGEIKNRNKFRKLHSDEFYKHYFNLSPEQVKQLEYKGLAQTKGGSEYQDYYRDLITPMQNLAAPFALVDYRVKPQRYVAYSPIDKKDVAYPGGNVLVYDYDPLAIKPYHMRTPKEKIEWEKKYGKKETTKAKPTPPSEKKKVVTPAPEPVRQTAPLVIPSFTPPIVPSGSVGVFGPGKARIGEYDEKTNTFYPDYGNLAARSKANQSDTDLLTDEEKLASYIASKTGKKPKIDVTLAKQRNGGVNKADEYPIEKLDQLLNFTNYNKPTKGGWLDKYN